jgi:hypothetical protein
MRRRIRKIDDSQLAFLCDLTAEGDIDISQATNQYLLKCPSSNFNVNLNQNFSEHFFDAIEPGTLANFLIEIW